MNLIQPKTLSQQTVILIASHQVPYTDNSLQLSEAVSMNFGFFFNLRAGEEATMQFPDLTPKIQSQFENYNKVRHFLNICANAGEAVNDCLLHLLEKMLPDKKVEFAKMEFSKRRDEFSDLIKKRQEIKKLPDLDSSSKRKEITSTFFQFVKLRNYYTHGKLILKYDSEQYYIQIIEKTTGIKTTCGIDRNILNSFIDTGAELIRLISIISNCV